MTVNVQVDLASGPVADAFIRILTNIADQTKRIEEKLTALLDIEARLRAVTHDLKTHGDALKAAVETQKP